MSLLFASSSLLLRFFVEEREPVRIPQKEPLKIATDPIYIKNHAQKLVERNERAKAAVDKDGNKMPQRTRSEGGRKRRKKK